MPTKTPSLVAVTFSNDSISRRVGRRRKTRLAESDEVAVQEGQVEEMVRELIRETISTHERYLDE